MLCLYVLGKDYKNEQKLVLCFKTWFSIKKELMGRPGTRRVLCVMSALVKITREKVAQPKTRKNQVFILSP